MERMEGRLLMKRADVLRVEGRRERGRRKLRWEDCVKRDLAGIGGAWRRGRGEGGWWRWQKDEINASITLYLRDQEEK